MTLGWHESHDDLWPSVDMIRMMTHDPRLTWVPWRIMTHGWHESHDDSWPSVDMSPMMTRDPRLTLVPWWLIIIIIIKTSSTGPSRKNKIVYKLLTQPHKHLRHGKTEKQAKGSNQRLTAPFITFRCQTQCREGHSTHESGPAGNTLQIVLQFVLQFFTFILQALMDDLQPQHEHVEFWQKQMEAHRTNNDSSSN